MSTAPIVQKVWNFCNTLRDDGVGYGDYLEQLTFLIFLKMADEVPRPPRNRDVGIQRGYDWNSLRMLKGAELEVRYVDILRELGTRPGILGQIFTKAQNKIQDPAKLARLIALVDEESWTMLDADVKGTSTKDCWNGTPKTQNPGQGSISRPGRLSGRWSSAWLRTPSARSRIPLVGPAASFLPRMTT